MEQCDLTINWLIWRPPKEEFKSDHHSWNIRKLECRRPLWRVEIQPGKRFDSLTVQPRQDGADRYDLLVEGPGEHDQGALAKNNRARKSLRPKKVPDIGVGGDLLADHVVVARRQDGIRMMKRMLE